MGVDFEVTHFFDEVCFPHKGLLFAAWLQQVCLRRTAGSSPLKNSLSLTSVNKLNEFGEGPSMLLHKHIIHVLVNCVVRVNSCMFPLFLVLCEQDGPEPQQTSHCSRANPFDWLAERRQKSLTFSFFVLGVKPSLRTET